MKKAILAIRALSLMVLGLSLGLLSCDLAPQDPDMLATIAPEFYSYLEYWTMDSLEERDQKLWYKIDARGNANDIFLHWQDSWYHEGRDASSRYTGDIWVTVYDQNMKDIYSRDNGFFIQYDDMTNINNGCLLAGDSVYYLEIEGYRDSTTGTFCICAVQEGAALTLPYSLPD